MEELILGEVRKKCVCLGERVEAVRVLVTVILSVVRRPV
jgi:hypothetical protein